MNFWKAEMHQELTDRLETASRVFPNHAKNVILFVGDGMSIATLTAARIYKAQFEENNFDTPESSFLAMERFGSHMGLSKVWERIGNPT